MQEKIYIISLGGSLIAPKSGIDWQYLKQFRKVIINKIRRGNKFVIITGGGNICRDYQAAAGKIVKLEKNTSDWLGIYTTRLNAQFIQLLFNDLASAEIITNPQARINIKKYFNRNKKMIIAGGWKPGRSTDYVAVLLAERLGARTVINLSNIDYAYTKDPRKYKSAKKIISTSWSEFRKIVGNKWDPGLNAPFDPIASKFAQTKKLKVVIMNGKNLNNLQKYFRGKNYKGTTIK